MSPTVWEQSKCLCSTGSSCYPGTKCCSKLRGVDEKVLDEITCLESFIPLFRLTLKKGGVNCGMSHLLLNEHPHGSDSRANFSWSPVLFGAAQLLLLSLLTDPLPPCPKTHVPAPPAALGQAHGKSWMGKDLSHCWVSGWEESEKYQDWPYFTILDTMLPTIPVL